MVFGELTNLCNGSNSNYSRFVLFAFTSFNIMDCVMTICIIQAWLGNYLVSHSYNPHFWRWKHTKVECIILSQLVGLSIMSHGTKYKSDIFKWLKKILLHVIWSHCMNFMNRFELHIGLLKCHKPCIIMHII